MRVCVCKFERENPIVATSAHASKKKLKKNLTMTTNTVIDDCWMPVAAANTTLEIITTT